MSLLSLILMSVAWSGVLWFGATLLCMLSPAPKTAQLIWRLAAFLMPAPLLLSLVVPGLPQAYGGDLPILPLLEPAIVTPGAADLADLSPGLKLPPLQDMLIGLLMFGWAARGLLWVRGQARLQAVKRRAKPSALDAVNWAVALGLSDEPEVRLIARGSAFVAGFKAPIIYVPEGLVGTADVQQILAHECVHLRRGDLVTRPIERGMADLFWFSPFVWAMRERLDYWREAVTDEAAAALTGDRVAYARALTTAARFARPLTPMPVAAFILPRQGTLKMRLIHLLKPAPRRPHRLAIAGVFAALVALPMAIAQGIAIKGNALPEAPVYTHAVLDKAKLTSAFGPRIHPISKQRQVHRGVDLAEEIGKPVYAPADGTVMIAGEKGAYGNLIALRVGADTILRFAQLDSMNVKAGETVQAGQIVGTLGASGAATGPHLHLEVWRGETSVDPEKEPGLVLAPVLREMKTAR